MSTIRRKRLAIGLAHAHAGFPRLDRDVRVRTIELGLARKYGSREVGADPLLAEDVLKLVKTLDGSARGDRDRAIFTLAFAGAFRSSEIVALEREHITFTETGATVFVARSKEDQLGRGKKTDICLGARAETCRRCARKRSRSAALPWMNALASSAALPDPPLVGRPGFRPGPRAGDISKWQKADITK